MKLFFLILIFWAIQIFPQISITGKIVDSSNNNFLNSANVLLLHLPDSLMIGTASDKKGTFKLENIKSGNYLLSVKYIGYETISFNLKVNNKPIDVGILKLKPQEVKLSDVLVVDKVPVAVQSGDTTVYNTDAFKVNKDAVAQDLLVKIPGIQVEDGKVKAQGEEVKKVYVDGKTFFGDDPNLALKNIPAEIIQKVQVFDQQSEQSQFSGFDDGSTSKAINIVTRLNIQNGTFGKLLAGYGTKDKYNVNSDLNLFNEDRRISIVAQLNNTNEQNFSSIDLLSTMGGPGQNGGMMQGGEMSGTGMGGGNQMSFIGSQNGETEVKSTGFNFNNKWGNDAELGTSYFFNNTDNNLLNTLDRTYFAISENNRNYFETDQSVKKNTNHRLNLRFDYQIDSLNSIRFIPGFSFQKNKANSVVDASTVENGSVITSTKSLTSSDMNGMNLNSMLMYRHKFNLTGRSIMLGINTSYNKNDGNTKQFSENKYYDLVVNADTIDQLTNVFNKGLTVSSNIMYTEPINSYNFLNFNASYSNSYETNDKETYEYIPYENSYSYLDTSLSNNYKKYYYSTNIGVGYRYKKNKIALNTNLVYNISSLKSEQLYPLKYNLDKTFYSFLPSLIFRYNISRDRNFNLFYRATNNAPSVTQLQNVLDNSNPLQLSIGNPDLKQEYSHSLTMRLSTINFSNMHSMFLMINGTYKNQYIGTNTILANRDTIVNGGVSLKAGSQLSSPVNIDGYVSAQSFLSYGMPVDFISCNLNLNASVNYARTPGIINGLKNYSNSLQYGLGITISSNISTDLDFLISSMTYYNTVKNNISTSNNDEYLSEVNNIRLYWLLFDEIVFRSDLTYKYDGGLTNGSDPNSLSLTLSIGTKLFEDNRGELRVSVYDVFNQEKSIYRQTTDSYYDQYNSNVIGRYFLFSFIYNLRVFS